MQITLEVRDIPSKLQPSACVCICVCKKVLFMVVNNVTVGLLKELAIVSRNQHLLWNVWKISHCLKSKHFIAARPVIIPPPSSNQFQINFFDSISLARGEIRANMTSLRFDAFINRWLALCSSPPACSTPSLVPIFVLHFSTVEHLLGARRGCRGNFMPQ